MDDDSKKTYFQSVRDKFAHEFNLAENKSVKIQIDKTFRNYRDHIQDILFNQKNTNLIVDAFSDDLMKLLNNLYESADESIESIAESLIHMMINRVISNQPRLNEFIIYHLLYRTFESKIARKNEI